MNQVINVFSEIGKLKTVIVHQPGAEIENLTPELLGELLFDDIPFLTEAIKEHQYFTKLMQDQGVEVLFIEELVAEAYDHAPDEIKQQFINQFIQEAEVNADLVAPLKEHFFKLSTLAMIKTMMAGVRITDVANVVNKDNYPFICDPLPNLLFQRDPFASIGHGASLNKMWSVTRNRETIFPDLVFKHHPRFQDKVPLYYDRSNEHSIEGGDILVLNKETLIIGATQRTMMPAIEVLAQNILNSEHAPYQKIIVLDLPKSRAFMHLDTVFTNIDFDKFLVHPFIFDKISEFKIYEITKTGKTKIDKDLVTYLSEVLHREIKFIPCGGKDEIDAKREQWNDGTNVLCLAPGVVIAYARNHVTNDILRQAGIKVLECPSSELSRGRGGPRCMSMPIYREDF